MSRSAWRRYAAFYRPVLPRLAAAVAVSAAGALLVVPMILLVRYTFDSVLPAGDARRLVLVGGAIVLVALAGAGAVLWTRHAILGMTKAVVQRLREESFEKLYALPRAWHTQAPRGRLHAAIVQDTERLDVSSNALVGVLLPALVAAAALCAVLAAMHEFLFLVLLSAAPVAWLVGRPLKRRAAARVREFHRAFESFSEGVQLVLRGMDLTRIQGAEEVELARQREILDRLRRTSGAMAWLQAAHTQLFATFAWISSALVLIAGGALVARGEMTLGALLAFYMAAGLLNGTVHQMSSALPQVVAGHESLVTLLALLDAPEAAPYHGRRRIDFGGEIAFEGVRFGYDERAVLRDVDLVLRPHSTTAIVGPNGSGKSTLLYLALGFYRPAEGRLRADGHAFDDLDVPHLRRFMGVVPQDPVLFPGTVLENLTYGTPGASPADVERALALADADAFVRALPRGWDTRVGDEGVLLSGGQRQRLAVARALLRRPRLLLLDEPANHLDDDGLARLLESLRTIAEAPTILTISHDLHVARQTERVYRLDGGRLEPWTAHA